MTKTKLQDQRIVIYGSGSAGLGIARQLRDAIKLESSCSDEEAGEKFWLLDKHGLLKSSLPKEHIRAEIEDMFIRKEEDLGEDETGLLEVVKRVKPTILIGTSTHAKAFTEEVIKEMSKHVDRPIIFPVRPFVLRDGSALTTFQLSNPTRLCEVQ